MYGSDSGSDSGLLQDAIDTAAESADADLVEDLLRFFVSVQDKECFAAVLFTCYDLIRPDVALELAWRNNYYDFFLPYMIQYMRHTHEKIKALEAKTLIKESEKEAESSAAVAEAAVSMGLYGNQLMLTDGPALLANEPFNPGMGMGGMYDQGGYGAGYGGAPQGFGQQPGYGAAPGYGGQPQPGFGGFPQGGYGGSW